VASDTDTNRCAPAVFEEIFDWFWGSTTKH
jgi:hypothetical protein